MLISALLISGVLFGSGCNLRKAGPTMTMSEEEFVDLYGRLLLWRDYQTSRSSSPDRVAPDSVSTAEVGLLRRYIEEAEHSTRDWIGILARANERRDSLQSELEQAVAPPPTSG
jgi:hypothetical protein